MAVLTSAGAAIALLDENEYELKVYALERLDKLVNEFWPEISESISKIEDLYDTADFANRELAALVASKIFYHLGELDDSLRFALCAGSHFEKTEDPLYVEQLISKCIDEYILQRSQLAVNSEPVDKDLEKVVERMFTRCAEHQEYEQAIGIALEARRLDVVEAMVKRGDQNKLLAYVLDVSMTLVLDVNFRNEVLNLLVSLYKTLQNPDYFSVSQCLVHLNQHKECANLLKDLINKNEELIAYQVAFDLEDNATQEFLAETSKHLPSSESDKEGVAENEKTNDSPYTKVKSILSGKETIKLHLDFLCRNNEADLLILKNTKHSVENGGSIYHSAMTFANAFMHAGTTRDSFIRENFEYFSRAANWSKFSATAALGVIHKGQLERSMHLLKSYLPRDGVSGESTYSEGGSLYALGLINANHGGSVLDYLKDKLNTQNNEVKHGACLGLGVAGMATDNEEIYKQLLETLSQDDAVAGEAAGLAMGLVKLGTAAQDKIDEMLEQARETQHEKIIRGLAIGLSLIMYNREDQAKDLIKNLLDDKDPILRYGGIHTIAMAYCATGNNWAIKKLLHFAVSDVNDDVRRAAVTALGFILVRTPEQVPRLVQLLAESYNPNVRYGSALALGISCAGTGRLEALELLEPMAKDPVDFVRQGAFIAQAMILVQQTESTNPKVAGVRKLFEEVIKDKHEDATAKFGAILAQGIIDAGGRNVTISLLSRTGHSNMSAIVGMAIFTQFWYWYPLTHMLSLAFTPTAIIGLNKNLEMPKFEFISNTKPSLYAYPAKLSPKQTTVVEKVATAVLSTTAKAKARAKRSEKEKGDQMDIDDEKPEKKEKEEAQPEEREVKKKEENFTVLENLFRVVPAQLKHITFKEDSRYVPINKNSLGGIMMMKDNTPAEEEELIKPMSVSKVVAGDDRATGDEETVAEEEAPPFEPFELPSDE